jgi:multidrug resistance efflux pump
MSEPRQGPSTTDSRNLSDRVRSLRLGQRPTEHRPGSSKLPWAICAVLLLVTSAFGYRAYRVQPAEPSHSETAPRDKKAGPTFSGLTTAEAATGEVVLQAKGYVTPLHLIQISPKVGGQLIEINPRFEEGEAFKKGELLARIESDDYKAEYEQALAAWEAARKRYEDLERTLPEEIAQAEADLEETRENATQLKLELARNKRLTLGNAMAQQDYERTKYSYDATLARIRRQEASLRMIKDKRGNLRVLAAKFDMKQAEAIKNKAELRYRWTEIRAPIDGTILSKKAELYNIVNPSAFSSGISASLCEMADLREIEIDLSIQERDVASVKPGQRCLVMPEAYQNDREFLARHPQGYAGFVSRLMPTADRAKGAVPVRVRIRREDIPPDEAGKYLRPDMGALVSFKNHEPQAKKN